MSGFDQDKRLQRFFARDKSPRKRLRTILEFCRIASECDVQQFFSQCHPAIFGVLTETIAQYERLKGNDWKSEDTSGLMAKFKKKPIFRDDWHDLMDVVNKMFSFCGEVVMRGWAHGSSIEIISRLCHPRSSPSIRPEGLHALIHLIDVKRAAGVTQEIRMLAAMFDWSSFMTSDSNLKPLALPRPGFEPVVLWSDPEVFGAVTPIDAIIEPDGAFDDPSTTTEALIKYLLQYSICGIDGDIGAPPAASCADVNGMPNDRLAHFTFWSEVLFVHIFPVLYPEACSTAKLGSGQRGFPICPIKLQIAVEQWLDMALKYRQFADVVWRAPDRVVVVHDIFKQRFLHKDPLAYELVDRTIRFYQFLIGSPEVPESVFVQKVEIHKPIEVERPAVKSTRLISDWYSTAAASGSSTASTTSSSSSSSKSTLKGFICPRLFLQEYLEYVIMFIDHAMIVFTYPSGSIAATTQASLVTNSIALVYQLSRLRIPLRNWEILRQQVFDIIDSSYVTNQVDALARTAERAIEVLFQLILSAPDRLDSLSHVEVTVRVRKWIAYDTQDKNSFPEKFVIEWVKQLISLSKYICATIDKKVTFTTVSRDEGPTITRPLPKLPAGAKEEESEENKQFTYDLQQRWAQTFTDDWLEIADDKTAMQLFNSILMLIPIQTVKLLSPTMATIVIKGVTSAIALVIDCGIVPRNHFTPLQVLSSDKDLRLKQKQINKERVRREAAEIRSPMIGISCATLVSTFAPWVLTLAARRHSYYQDARCAAFEGLLRIFTCRTFSAMPPQYEPMMLGLIYDILLTSNTVPVIVSNIDYLCDLALTDNPCIVPLVGILIDVGRKVFTYEYPVKFDPKTVLKYRKSAVRLITSLVFFTGRYGHIRQLPVTGTESSDSLTSSMIDARRTRDSRSSITELLQREGEVSTHMMETASDEPMSDKRTMMHVCETRFLIRDCVASFVPLVKVGDVKLIQSIVHVLFNLITNEVMMIESQSGFLRKENGDVDISFLDSCVKILTEYCGERRAELALVAIEATHNLSLFAIPVKRNSPTVLVHLFLSLASVIMHNVISVIQRDQLIGAAGGDIPGGQDSQIEDSLKKVNACMESMVRWAMRCPEIVDNSDICKALFDSFEGCLAGRVPFLAIEREEGVAKSSILFPKMLSDLLSRKEEKFQVSMMDDVADIAEQWLFHILNRLHIFPLRDGCDVVDSSAYTEFRAASAVETEEEGAAKTSGDPESGTVLHLVYKGCVIVTLFAGSQDSHGEIIIREVSGNHVMKCRAIDPNPRDLPPDFLSSLKSRKKETQEMIRTLLGQEGDVDADFMRTPSIRVESNPIFSPRRVAVEKTVEIVPVKVESSSMSQSSSSSPVEPPDQSLGKRVMSFRGLAAKDKKPAKAILTSGQLPPTMTSSPVLSSTPQSSSTPSAINIANSSTTVGTLAKSASKDAEQSETDNFDNPLSDDAANVRGGVDDDDLEEKSSVISAKTVATAAIVADQQIAFDLNKDLLGSFMDLLPMEDCDDPTLVGGNFTLSKYGTYTTEEYSYEQLVGVNRAIETLLRVIYDPLLSPRFQQFLSSELAVESYNFILAIEGLISTDWGAMMTYEGGRRGAANASAISNKILMVCEYIFHRFIKRGATEEVNISATQAREVSAVIEHMRSHPVSAGQVDVVLKAFEPARSEILRMLQRDKLGRFIDAQAESGGEGLLVSPLSPLFSTSNQSSAAATFAAGMNPKQQMRRNMSSISLLVVPNNVISFMEDLEKLEKEIIIASEAERFHAKQLSPEPTCREMPTQGNRFSALDVIRLFFSHFGQLPARRPQSSYDSVQLILPTDDAAEKNLYRQLKHLDSLSTRETVKLGVSYVGPGQVDQKEIFDNQRGSLEFEEFVCSLGWEVDLRKHKGFTGKLDSRGYQDGTKHIYFADDEVEVFFHISTRLTHTDGDAQQIKKKRHIGNDAVLIAWSEHSRDFIPDTITSDFGDVVIVIYPLSAAHSTGSACNMYRIQVWKRDGLNSTVGPLCDGSIVPRHLLGPLVRQTAVNANRIVREMQAEMGTVPYQKPYPTRKKYIQDIISSFAVPYTHESMLCALFKKYTPSAAAEFAGARLGRTFSGSGPGGGFGGDDKTGGSDSSDASNNNNGGGSDSNAPPLPPPRKGSALGSNTTASTSPTGGNMFTSHYVEFPRESVSKRFSFHSLWKNTDDASKKPVEEGSHDTAELSEEDA